MIKTKLQAEWHYLNIGEAERLVYQKVKIIMRYTACQGFMNQFYSHLDAITLAVALNAEIVLPPSWSRENYGYYFSHDQTINNLTFTPSSLEKVINVQYLIDYWKKYNITIYNTPPLDKFADPRKPGKAYPLYKQDNVDLRFRTYLHDVQMKQYELSAFKDIVQQHIVSFANKLQKEDPKLKVEYVILDCSCTFFSLNTQSDLQLVSKVAKSIQFAPQIMSIANYIIDQLPKKYNGVHLRLENDALDWQVQQGGEASLWEKYINAMKDANFSSSDPLYIASGLLSYEMGIQKFTRKILYILGSELASNVFWKEGFINTTGLTSEQSALIDFLVLVQSNKFVGISYSTFSFAIREFKALWNHEDKSNSILLFYNPMQPQGALFQRAATLTN